MSIQKKHEELIESSYKELELLKNEVTQLEDIRKNIENLIGSNNELPPFFLELYQKIETLSVTYTKGIDDVTRQYLLDANTYFVERLIELQTEISNLKSQIERISSIDFTGLFNDLQKVFIEQTKKDIAIELEKIGEKADDFQNKIDALQTEVERLEKIDLVKEFDKLQATLASIFTAINSLNTNLASVVSTLTGIVTSLGTIQTKFTNEFIDLNKNINKLESNILDELIQAEGNNKNRFDSIDTQFTAIDKDLKSQFEKINTTIDSIVNQNNLLNKEIKTNRIILFIGSVISFCLLIYLGFLKK
jgi:uncharacterized protein YukE